MKSFDNGAAVPLTDVPLLSVDRWRETVVGALDGGAHLASLAPYPGPGGCRLVAVLADVARGNLSAVQTMLGPTYPALTPDCPQAHMFERAVWERTGVVPAGHPRLLPVRFPKGGAGCATVFTVHGVEVHEVAVGPVHAGIIEPGHFRFQCHGETVLHLDISLGYQHRGVEDALAGGPNERTVHFVETLAGDTTIGHGTAYAAVVEALTGAVAPPRAAALRAVALELERLANHTGDLGALAGDVGFLPTSAWCGRLRGDYLNMTALLCGNRFGRGPVRPGGTAFDMDEARIRDLCDRCTATTRDVRGAVDLLLDTPSVLARFEDTGGLSSADATALGLVGPAARACGVRRDVRFDFPHGAYRSVQLPLELDQRGDVLGRAQVRRQEIVASAAFVGDVLATLPTGPVSTPTVAPLAADSLAVALVEGWRGEICHVAVTDGHGRFRSYAVTDPSFHNWPGLARAMRDQQISDFPLCNKSFNLSYCGFDL